MYLLDTNICIFLSKNRSPELLQKFKSTKNVGVSSITYAELMFGVENGAPHLMDGRRQQWNLFMEKVKPHSWNFAAAEVYGYIRSDLKKRGEIIGQMDMLIAAHAISLDATLITNNTREFSRINSLKIEDWS